MLLSALIHRKFFHLDSRLRAWKSKIGLFVATAADVVVNCSLGYYNSMSLEHVCVCVFGKCQVSVYVELLVRFCNPPLLSVVDVHISTSDFYIIALDSRRML